MPTKHKTIRSLKNVSGCNCHNMSGLAKPSKQCRVQIKKRVKVCVPGNKKNKCTIKIVRMFKLVPCKTRKRKRY